MPTTLDVGAPGGEFYLWVGLFTQAAVDPAIQKRLRDGVVAAFRDADMQRALATTGIEADHREGDAFRAFLDADRVRVEAAVQRIGRVE